MENAYFTSIYGLLKTGLQLCTMGKADKGPPSPGSAVCSSVVDAAVI